MPLGGRRLFAAKRATIGSLLLGDVRRAPALHLAAELDYLRAAHAGVEQERQREPRLTTNRVLALELVHLVDRPGMEYPTDGRRGQQTGRLRKKNRRQIGRHQVAIIAADDLTFGLTRMYMALTEDYHVTTNVFGDAIKADDWLGLGVEMEQILRQTVD